MITIGSPILRNRYFAPPCYSIAVFSDDRNHPKLSRLARPGARAIVDILYFEAASEAESLAAATAYFNAAVDEKFNAIRAALV